MSLTGGAAAPDGNVGFTLQPDGRARVVKALGEIGAALPEGAAILTDRAGRIVEVSRRPTGVDLEALAALAAGCSAGTNELAGRLGDRSFALTFEHEDDRQVFVAAVADRALLLVLLKGAGGLDRLDSLMASRAGQDLAAAVQGAREPLKAVPPPRIDPREVPEALSDRMHVLDARVADYQATRRKEFTDEVRTRLLRDRDELARALARGLWDVATQVLDSLDRWLAVAFR